MKFFVLVCSLAALARASLEPAGFRSPGSDPAYLPPSTVGRSPVGRHVPSSLDSRSHRVGSHELSKVLVSPFRDSPEPFSRHSPADWRSSEQRSRGGDDFVPTPNPSSPYSSADWRSSEQDSRGGDDFVPTPNPSSPYSSADWRSSEQRSRGGDDFVPTLNPSSRYSPADSRSSEQDSRGGDDFVPTPNPSSRYSLADWRSSEQDSRGGDDFVPTPNPSSRYSPADWRSSERDSRGGDDFVPTPNPSIRYSPAAEIRRSFARTSPVDDYLPPRKIQPSNAYLAPKKNPGQSAVGFSRTTSGFPSTGRYSGSSYGNERNRLDEARSGTGAPGYNFHAPENHTPAKYDFEYRVKDKRGNDYGHRESRTGEHAQGVYTVLLPDSRRQIVHYEADSHGYRPTITYEDASSQSLRNDQAYRYRTSRSLADRRFF